MLEAPLYKEVKQALTRELAGGQWPPGEPLPSESALARRFQVSIGTVRKAVGELVAERALVRQQGRGTFVSTHDSKRLLFHFFHIVPRDGGSVYPDTRLLSFARDRAGATEAARLAIAAGDPVWRIRNLLTLEGMPALVDDIVLARTRFPDLTERVFTRRENTIYNLYQARYGQNVLRTTERLRAVLADAGTARLLGVRRGAPLLEIDRVALTYNDVPVELRRSRVDTSRYDYLSDLGKGEHAHQA